MIGKTKEHGTTIEFFPDGEVMEVLEFDSEILIKRFKEMAYLNHNITISFTDEKTGKREKYHFKGGLKQFVEDINKKPLLSEIISFEVSDEELEAEIAP